MIHFLRSRSKFHSTNEKSLESIRVARELTEMSISSDGVVNHHFTGELRAADGFFRVFIYKNISAQQAEQIIVRHD